MQVIPTILLTGFLGAGKTTALNAILKFLKPLNINIALLINEFGSINIDSELVDKQYKKNIFEVNQGSIFCICTRDQFFKALDKIIQKQPPFEFLLIEASGIASTGDLNEYLNTEAYMERLAIIENICIIDAVNFHKVFATLPAIKNQVQEATICIINKIDMAKDNDIDINVIENIIKELNPDARIFKAIYGELDFKNIINLKNPKRWSSFSQLKKQRPSAIYTITLESEGQVNIDDIKQFIASLNEKLLRAKGFIQSENKTFFVEFINGEIKISPWAKNIKSKNTLVLIGYKMDENLLKTDFLKLRRTAI
jgi:G3E family GTPase